MVQADINSEAEAVLEVVDKLRDAGIEVTRISTQSE